MNIEGAFDKRGRQKPIEPRSVIISNMRGQKGRKRSGIAQALVGTAAEAQGVGWGLLGVSGFVTDVRQILSGQSSLRW